MAHTTSSTEIRFDHFVYDNTPSLLPLADTDETGDVPVDWDETVTAAGLDPDDERTIITTLAEEWEGYPAGSIVVTEMALEGYRFAIQSNGRDPSLGRPVVEDRNDTKIALAEHTPDGECWIVQYCSLHTRPSTSPLFGQSDDSECVGTRIIASVGPIAGSDLFPDGDWPIHDTKAILDQIDRVDWELDIEDAEWLQAEEDAGRLTYPYGAR